MWSIYEQMSVFCESGNEYSVCVKCWEILDKLRDYYLIKITLLHGISWLVSLLIRLKLPLYMYCDTV